MKIGVTDPTSSHLDQNLARARCWNRQFLNAQRFTERAYHSGSHHLSHSNSSPELGFAALLIVTVYPVPGLAAEAARGDQFLKQRTGAVL